MNESMSPGRWLSEQTTPARAPLVLATVAGVVAGLLTIAQAGILAWLLAGFLVEARPTPALVPTLGLLLTVVAARALTGWLRDVAGLRAADRIIGTLRERLFDRLAARGPVHLAEHPPGRLAAAHVEQLQALEGYYARFLPQTWLAVVVPLAIGAAVLLLDWLAAALLLLSAPLIPAFMAIIGMGAEQISQSQQAAVARASGHFLDRVRGLTTLRLFDHAEASAAEVEAVADDYRQRTLRTLRVAFLSSAVLEFFAAVAVAVVAIYIGFALLGYVTFGPAGELELFTGLFVLLLAPEFFMPLRQLASHYHDRADAVGAAAELHPLFGGETVGRSATTTGPGSGVHASAPMVELSGVTVDYPDGRRGLEGVDLRVSPGERVVLAGPSGGGKSTLLALLAGFVALAGGRLHIGESDGADVDAVAWMGQRTHLFSTTLRENIRLGRPDADDAAVDEVAERAGVAEMAMALPEGLETAVGEGGVPLSGGQAQRVALARTLLKGAPVLLLDEPTAGLDPEGEAGLVAALERTLSSTGATVIIATHHPRLRELGRRVVRVEAGRLTEVVVG
ncbi:MAG: thiol reductant ABC exporter subunit CydD [Pseudomonadota bacterium]